MKYMNSYDSQIWRLIFYFISIMSFIFLYIYFYKKFIELGYIDKDHNILDISVFNDKINIYSYEDNKFSGLKRVVEENVVIDFDEKEIKRIPLKMKYIGRQGYPFEDMQDYIAYKERILNNLENNYEIYEFL